MTSCAAFEKLPAGEAATRDLIRRAQRARSTPSQAFASDAELLEAFRIVIELPRCGAVSRPDLPALARHQRASFTARVRLTRKATPLLSRMRSARLDSLERDILLVLLLMALGMVQREGVGAATQADVQALLGSGPAGALEVMRRLCPASRLVRSGLVEIDAEAPPGLRSLAAASDLLDDTLAGRSPRPGDGWSVRSHEDLMGRCHELMANLARRGREVMMAAPGRREERVVSRLTSRIRWQTEELVHTLERHRSWPLGRLFLGQGLTAPEMHVMLLLLGWELGVGPSDEAVTGGGLARCVSTRPAEVEGRVRLLRQGARLRRLKLVECTGSDTGASAVRGEANLSEMSFALTEAALRQLRVQPRRRGGFPLRAPLVRREQLVLAPRVHRALDLALAQARHQRVLYEKWGMGAAVAYGRGTTMLFSGPPGVGKTAAAEALAHELGKAILEVSYAEVQNAYYGETEKQIVRVFGRARQADAVLFWDEADAMFVDRRRLHAQNDIRHADVLLQEIERFEGTCILATNRRDALDEALARRVAIKVEFEAPDEAMRRAIWRKLVPPELPLGPDVDLDALAACDLTGGQIRNVVLNAARSALTRGVRARVAREDLDGAVALELERPAARSRVGFA